MACLDAVFFDFDKTLSRPAQKILRFNDFVVADRPFITSLTQNEVLDCCFGGKSRVERIAAMLATLTGAGVKVYIVSHGHTESVVWLLKMVGLMEFFMKAPQSHRVYGKDSPQLKAVNGQKARFIQQVMQAPEHGWHKHRCLFVDDDLRNIQSCKELQVIACLHVQAHPGGGISTQEMEYIEQLADVVPDAAPSAKQNGPGFSLARCGLDAVFFDFDKTLSRPEHKVDRFNDFVVADRPFITSLTQSEILDCCFGGKARVERIAAMLAMLTGAGVKMYIVSHGHTESVVRLLKMVGLMEFFMKAPQSHRVYGKDSPQLKAVNGQKARFIQQVMQAPEHGWHKQRCLFIDDDLRNIQPCEQLQVIACLHVQAHPGGGISTQEMEYIEQLADIVPDAAPSAKLRRGGA